MKKKFEPILISLLLMSSLLSCSTRSSLDSNRMEEKFQTAVPVPDMNQSLEIKIDEDQSVFPNGFDIPLVIQNKSPHFLFFNYEANCIKLFTPRGTEWIEVKNGLTYLGTTTLSPQGNLPLDLDFNWARPEVDEALFKDSDNDIVVRIVVTGEIMENDKPTGTLVGAYLDVYITP